MARKSKKGGNSRLDLAMAALAAGSVGFVVYVMPNASFERAVELSGLPLILPAANPPLGMTARLAAAAFAATGIFVLVSLVLRALGKPAARPEPNPQRRSEPEEIEIPLPRIRRADAHPDAPARRPIFAGLDLGAPFDASTYGQEPPADEVGEEAVTAREELHYLPAEAEEETASSTEELHYPVHELEERPEEGPLPSFIVPDEEEARAPDTYACASEAPERADESKDSISHLMQRLELGLVRRQGSQSDRVTPFARPEAGETPNQMDHRLRSAIDDLQKLAARGG